MSENSTTTNPDSAKLDWLVRLSAANLIIMIVGVGGLLFGLLPKIERTVQVSERLEARFQSFADEVQPVVKAGAGKTIETIQKIDADRLSEKATEKADSLIDSATERAKRFLDKKD